MITYTLPEIRRLLAHLILRHAAPAEHVWSWSHWRRRRQYQARISHYRRRGYPPITAVESPSTATGGGGGPAVSDSLRGCRPVTKGGAACSATEVDGEPLVQSNDRQIRP